VAAWVANQIRLNIYEERAELNDVPIPNGWVWNSKKEEGFIIYVH
jgi:hypothetical protein